MTLRCPNCGAELVVALVRTVRDMETMDRPEDRRRAWAAAETSALLNEANSGFPNPDPEADE